MGTFGTVVGAHPKVRHITIRVAKMPRPGLPSFGLSYFQKLAVGPVKILS